METITRIEDKIDRIITSMSAIDKALAVQAAEAHDRLRRIAALEAEIAPLQTQVTRWKAVWAFALGLPSVAAALHWILS